MKFHMLEGLEVCLHILYDMFLLRSAIILMAKYLRLYMQGDHDVFEE